MNDYRIEITITARHADAMALTQVLRGLMRDSALMREFRERRHLHLRDLDVAGVYLQELTPDELQRKLPSV